MVGDRSLQYVDGAWPVFMVVNRAKDASRLEGHHTRSKLAPYHALDLRAKVNCCKKLYRNTFRLRCHLFVAQIVLPNKTFLMNYELLFRGNVIDCHKADDSADKNENCRATQPENRARQS